MRPLDIIILMQHLRGTRQKVLLEYPTSIRNLVKRGYLTEERQLTVKGREYCNAVLEVPAP